LDDAVFDELVAGMTVSAADPSAVTEDAAPESESPPTDEASTTEQDASSEPTAMEAAPPEAAKTDAAPPAPNWESPDNPFYQDALRHQQLQQEIARVQALQAQENLRQTISSLADGDTDRQAQLYGLLANVTQPLQQNASALEQRAVSGEKAATALWIAMQATGDEALKERVKNLANQLMTVEGPEQMERIAFTERDAAKKYGEQIALKDKEIAELRRQINAKAELTDRQLRGADAVDAGRGTGGGGSPAPAQANDFDSFFESIFERKSA